MAEESFVVVGVYGDGLYQIVFGTYEAAREGLDFLGWRVTRMSTPKGEGRPSDVWFFNSLVGGDGRLFHDGDRGWVFLAADGWLSRVYAKLAAKGVIGPPSADRP